LTSALASADLSRFWPREQFKSIYTYSLSQIMLSEEEVIVEEVKEERKGLLQRRRRT